jgi:hypothetical protein
MIRTFGVHVVAESPVVSVPGLAGSALCLIGAAIILFAPRSAAGAPATNRARPVGYAGRGSETCE